MTIRVVLVFVVIAALAAVLFYSQSRVEPLKVSGIIEADEIRLGSRVGGRVAKVHVEEGATVAAGQKLVELEPFDWNEKLREAEANLKALDEKLALLQAGNRPEEIGQAEAHYLQLVEREKKLKEGPRSEEKLAAKAQLELAEARLTRAEQNFKRVQSLFIQRPGAVTEDELERATEERNVARAAREARFQESEQLRNGARPEDIAEAEQMSKEAQLAWELMKKGPRVEDIRQAQAARDAAQAARDALARQKQELMIVSPIAGAIEALGLQPGDLVAAGAPVLTMVDHKRMWVRAYVPQNHLDIQLGQKVVVTVDSFPDEKFRGEIVFISRQGEFTPSNVQTPDERSKQVFRIKVMLDANAAKILRPGMTADVWLDPPQAANDLGGKNSTPTATPTSAPAAPANTAAEATGP